MIEYDDDYCMNKCDGHCCSSYTVLLTSEDALRLHEGLSLSPKEYLTIYDASVENQNFYPVIKMQGIDVVLGIKFKPGTTTCYFLREDGLCSVHQIKPRVCQTYPFTMDLKGNLIRMEGIDNVCPHHWMPKSPEMTERIKNSLLASWEEIKKYRELVEKWNQTRPEGSFLEFLKFIGCL
ncbi:MAG: YkgJ family cysteine cluster protein [Candidatus Helarchaeales archaeon]